MKSVLILGSALALGLPALASAQSDPTAGVQADVTTGAGDATAATTAATQATDVGAAVEAGFPTYDADKSGDLSKAEFSAWVVTLKQKSEPGKSAAELGSWAGSAFTQADADKNETVSKAELTAFLNG